MGTQTYSLKLTDGVLGSFGGGQLSLTVGADGNVTGKGSVSDTTVTYLIFGLLPVTVHEHLALGDVTGTVTASGMWSLKFPLSLSLVSVKLFGFIPLVSEGGVCVSAAKTVSFSQTASSSTLIANSALGAFSGCGLFGAIANLYGSMPAAITASITAGK